MKMMDMGPSIRALVIDHHSGMAPVVAAALAGVEELRFETAPVFSPVEALRLAASHAADLAIVCSAASGPGALDQVRELHQLGLDLPVVLVTPQVDRIARINAARAGIAQSFTTDEAGSTRVVLNLVVNAAHAIQDVVRGSEQKGRIGLRTSITGNDVLIVVSDMGTGIASEVVPRIFDPFFTTKEVGKGTGQGLAIARTIVKDHHGGDIAVDSRRGEGTTFSVRLPIAPAKGNLAGDNSRQGRYLDAP